MNPFEIHQNLVHPLTISMQIKLDEYQTLFLWELLSDLISAPESKQHYFCVEEHGCTQGRNVL